MLWVGIDPGVTGGVALLDEAKNDDVFIYNMPTVPVRRPKKKRKKTVAEIEMEILESKIHSWEIHNKFEKCKDGDPEYLNLLKEKVADKIRKPREYSEKEKFDEDEFDNILKSFELLLPNVHIVCEKLWPGMGTASPAAMGVLFDQYGYIRASLKRSPVPHTFITPQSWKKIVGLPKVGSKLGDIRRARELYPHADLKGPGKRTEKDGRADALLLAHAGKIHIGGKQ